MTAAVATIIDGKEVAKSIRQGLKPRIAKLKEQEIVPGLAAVLVGDNPASQTYVNSKAKACDRLGMYSEVIRKPASLSQDELIEIVEGLNANPKIHGILVQSPLPEQIDEPEITVHLSPEKDVDGFHPFNVGQMLIGRGKLLPCTPHGIIKLLEYYNISTEGKEAVIVGRSNIVGKPVAVLLMQKGKMANATVTIAHSRTSNLSEVCSRADILIAAIGRANFITKEMVKAGAAVIDVGINRIDDSNTEKGYRLVGDVDFEACKEKASFITPVPGGVGPMTIAMLLSNTVTAAENIGS